MCRSSSSPSVLSLGEGLNRASRIGWLRCEFNTTLGRNAMFAVYSDSKLSGTTAAMNVNLPRNVRNKNHLSLWKSHKNSRILFTRRMDDHPHTSCVQGQTNNCHHSQWYKAALFHIYKRLTVSSATTCKREYSVV